MNTLTEIKDEIISGCEYIGIKASGSVRGEGYATLDCDISIVTRSHLPDKYIKKLREIFFMVEVHELNSKKPKRNHGLPTQLIKISVGLDTP